MAKNQSFEPYQVLWMLSYKGYINDSEGKQDTVN
jgi:hypothetical protein